MFELLVVHGGVEGLRQAVGLCREAHTSGETGTKLMII